MGRYDFRAQRVLASANLALETKRITTPPVWHDVVQNIPPPPRLVRPVKKNVARGSYKPRRIRYPEDELRTEFFADHPWELARPRVVLEDSGNDHKGYDWSVLEQEGKRIDGESVIQHQLYLKQHGIKSDGHAEAQPLSHYAAYDVARKKLYAHRHFEDVERRIAREEALHTGAYFDAGANAVAVPLEDAAFEQWKRWAADRATMIKNGRMAGYSGSEAEEDDAGAVRLSDRAAAEEEEMAGRVETPDVPVEGLPETSQGAVTDAVGEMTLGRR